MPTFSNQSIVHLSCLVSFYEFNSVRNNYLYFITEHMVATLILWRTTLNQIHLLDALVLMKEVLFWTTGEVIGNLIEGIAEDVPSVKANFAVEQALQTAVEKEGAEAADVMFNKKDDAQLVIYVMVTICRNAIMSKTFTKNTNRNVWTWYRFDVKITQVSHVTILIYWVKNLLQWNNCLIFNF